ncbi:MAG: hypothetical protein HGA80_09130 [Candidatus Omnitrophica bacterium]|nr:hypothetical protein [Candidatus Omnitrophota bacterium]
MKFLRAHAKKAFQLFMKGEDKSTAKALIDAFNYVVDDPNDSDIQKLILTGEYTIYVFKILATIGMLSRSPDQVQYETVFKYLGLNDALLDQFVKIASSLKSVDDAKAFALSIESIMIGMNPNDKSNPVFLPLPVDAREQLVKIRAERQAAIKKEMQEKVILAAEKARSLLNNSFDFLSGLMGVMGLDKRDNNEKILFSRAKTADSFLKKLDDGDTDLNRVMDWDGGRIGMYTDDSLGDMVKGVRSIIAGSLEFNRYQEDIMKRKKALLQFMHSPGLKNSKKRDYTNKYLEVNNAAENFRDVGTATPKRILVRAVNYYDTLTGTSASSSTPDWYRAIHLIFMLGDGDSTIEVQVKTLLMAILQAFEHKINFKAKEPFPLTDSLKRGIWLANAVEAANYSISRSKNALQGALTHNMQSRGVSLEEKATDSAMKGGIDARNVDGSVRVNAEANAPALEFGGAGMLAGDLDGLTPRILSVQAVEGFSFLAQAAPGTSGAK